MESAEEAKRVHGETVALDAASHGKGKFGVTIRVPCGVVVAISPFNFPLNLVCHKVGPAIAGGNAVIVKPATDTPLSALRLTEILLEAGLPPEGINALTGSGGEVGDWLVADRRVRKITFTGSRDVGEHICRTAGIKRVTMELGSNAPVIVMPDADMEKVAVAVASTGYANAGQVCISTQRVLAASGVYEDFLDALRPKVAALKVGNQLDPTVHVGPMIREKEAVRVDEWVKEAVANGARVVTGGTRQGAMYAPTVVADVKPQMRISCDELFGPAAAVTPFTDIVEATAAANDTEYGLGGRMFGHCIRASSIRIVSGSACATGATPPIAKPVRARTKSASARATGSATSPATLRSSTRFAPLVMTRTAPWVFSPRKTSDFAIWSTRQPIARAASAEVRAGCWRATTVWPPPAAASTSCTRRPLGPSARALPSSAITESARLAPRRPAPASPASCLPARRTGPLPRR